MGDDSNIIVALDGVDRDSALSIADKIGDRVWGFKVNDLLIRYGVSIVEELSERGRVMADPKLYDIPKTILNGISVLTGAGASIITVHMSANFNPIDHGSNGHPDSLAGISVLTSFNDESCKKVYGSPILECIDGFAHLADSYGYGYLVCSAADIAQNHYLRARRFKRICPAIRPIWSLSGSDDQKRIVTPREAISNGADLLVMGRPLGIPGQTLDFISDAVDRTNEEIN